MADAVLDSSAILALLDAEPGADAVAPLLEGALVSAVNLAEVVSKMLDRRSPPGDVRLRLGSLPVDVRPFDEDAAFDAGMLRAVTARRGLSLGDRACLALARREGLPVLTADRAWDGLDIGVEIRLIR